MLDLLDALVVQWIGHPPAKWEMQVRFLPGAPERKLQVGADRLASLGGKTPRRFGFPFEVAVSHWGEEKFLIP